MTNQTTDEAAVDIVERLRFSHSQGLFEAVDKGMHVPYEEAADEIQSLRAQLTAATQRAEQAERMLAERDTALKPFRDFAEFAVGEDDWKGWHCFDRIKDHFDPEDFRAALTSIRSAVSGEQGV